MARSFALAALVVLQLPLVASAQQSDDELARHFFETGRTYFSRAQYEEAAEAFAEAYRLSGRAALLVNQARALEASGDLPGAIVALERATEELDPDDDVYPTIAPRLERLRAQQAQAEAQAAEGSAEEGTGEGAEVTVAPVQPPEEPAADSGPGTLFWVGLGTASLGGVLLVTSLATGLAAHGVYGDLEDACPGDVCPPDRAGDIDRGNALSAVSTALLFIGVAAAAVGVTLILLDGGSDEEEPAVALRVGPGSLRVDGRF
jgi:tetratricopeptide (TPR) repeat protein